MIIPFSAGTRDKKPRFTREYLQENTTKRVANAISALGKFFGAGTCNKGNECPFAHGEDDLATVRLSPG